MPLNFGPPVIDFSPLGKLGETYDAGVKRNREAAMNDARQKALAGFGQNSDLAALGQTLLRSGDLEGGMSALRLDAANKGTPWQRERAAEEDRRAGETHRDLQTEREQNERYRREQQERSRWERTEEIVTDSAGNETKRRGERDLTTGIIHWDDGTTSSGGRGTGPRSGGEDDPNLPPVNAQTAQLALSPQTSTDPGYVIPKTLQGFPVGTTLPPAALAQLQPPPADGAAVAAPAAAQAAPLAPPAPAGGAAVAQAPLPPVAAAPNASTVQPRLNREDPLEPPTVPFVRKPPPNVNIKGWIAAEVKRVAEVTGLGSDKPPTESQAASAAFANRMQGAEKEFRPVTEDSTGFGNRLADVVTGGSGFLRNKLTSDKYQASIAAKKEWIAALLRKDSGAAVSDQEFEYYNDVYFPKSGQSEVLVKQYERARERAYEGLRQGLTPGQITNLSKTAAGGGPGLEPARGTPGEVAAPPVLKFDSNGNAIR